MINKKFFLECLVGFSLLLIYFSIYQVAETENAIRLSNTRLLKLPAQYDLITKPGLHFKWPLVERIALVDKRVQRTKIRSNSLLIQENDTMQIDYCIHWRITNPYRYVKFISQDVSDWPTLLRSLSNQNLQRHWKVIRIENPMQKKFDLLRHDLNERARELGIEILSCYVLQKIPSSNTKKNSLQRTHTMETKEVQKILYQGKVRAHSMISQAKIKQSVLKTQAKCKARNIEHEGQALAMQIYLHAYNQAPKFAVFYQNLQEEVLRLRQDPNLASFYQILPRYISNFNQKVSHQSL